MNRETITKVVAEAGQGVHQAAIEALIQPSIHVTATQLAGRPGGWRSATGEEAVDDEAIAAFDAAMTALPLGASRFGGLPDLPPGTDWPARDGVPMEFIAQLRLDELAGHDELGRLPRQGTLCFFWNSQWASTDMDGDGCCKVIFHDGPVDGLVRTSPPRVEWKSEFSDAPQTAPFVHGLASLEFSPFLALPGGVGPYATGALGEIYQDFHCGISSQLQPGGEEAPQNHVLGYVDEQDYVEAHVNGTDDQLLLQVDSDDAAEFQFGDCNKLFFLLSKAELAARDFSKVRVYSMLG